MKRALGILVAVLAIAAVFGIHAYLDARRARRTAEQEQAARLARRARLDRLGIASDGTEEFFALPPTIPPTSGRRNWALRCIATRD